MIPANFKIKDKESRQYAHVAAIRSGAHGVEFYVARFGESYKWELSRHFIWEN